MIRMQSTLRLYYSIPKRISVTLRNKSSKSDDSNKDDKKKQIKNPDAVNKLNSLLKQMVDDDSAKSKNKLDLAKPRGRMHAREAGTVNVKSEKIEEKMINAVQDVAEVIGGNKNQTESELLSKLLNGSTGKANTAANLSDIVKDMKIDRTPTKSVETTSRAQQVRQLLDRADKTRGNTQNQAGRVRKSVSRDMRDINRNVESIDIFNGPKLEIFTSKFDDSSIDTKRMWNKLYERELKMAVTHPPSNYFQEMILWTEQGKLWQFPIDNEFGLEGERNVDFSEHIFLDRHLEGWCPTKGPIRHFMELVCVGLSKNAFLTVDEKREHIEWYRNYFEDKKQLLVDTGAIPAEEVKKQVESA